MGVKFEITIEIDASMNEVWNKLVDWKFQSDWMALTRVQSSHQGSQDSGIGTTIDAFTGIWKIGILDRMKVVEWSPPELCVVDHYGRWIKGKGIFSLRPHSTSENEKTLFHWYEEIEGFRLMIMLLKPGIMAGVYFSLRSFARTFKGKRR